MRTLTEKSYRRVSESSEMMFCEAASIFVKGLASSFMFALTMGASGDVSVSAFVAVAYVTVLVSVATLSIETLKVPSFFKKSHK